MNKPVRLAVNGYGRIGRCFLRAVYESPLKDDFRIVAINEPSDLATMAYLTRFDSTHGIFRGVVEQGEHCLKIDGVEIPVTHARNPEEIDWSEMGIDLLIECSGQYGTRDDLTRFLDAGCPRMLVSQPAHNAQAVDFTVVYGVNHADMDTGARIVSNASCTTNAIVPVLDQLQRAFGIEHAFLTTLHSVMNDQPMIDGYHHADLRRTRSAMQSIIPVSTGLAQGVERLLPGLRGKVQAKAVRVPILNVSAIDLMVDLQRVVTAADINSLMAGAASRQPGLMAYSDHPCVSVDFNHDPHSVVVDGSQTRTNGTTFANLFVWFDNEWGFANRMLDVARFWAGSFN